MRLLLALLVLIFALPAQAEKIRPPSWNQGSNKETGNPRTSGNKIRSVEEEKKRKAEMTRRMRAVLAEQKVSSGKESSKFKKNKNGKLEFKQRLTGKQQAQTAVGRLWDDIFN